MNYFVSALFLLTLFILCRHEFAVAAGVDGGVLAITLREHTLISGPDILLGDVAELSGSDPAVRDHLLGLRLAAAPRVGYTNRIGRAQVERALRIGRGPGDLAFSIRGAAAVTVEAASQLLKADAIIAASRDALVVELGRNYSGIEATLASSVSDIALPEGSYTLHPRLSELALLEPRKLVWLDIMMGARVYRSLPVVYAVRSSQSVYVARRALEAGMLISVDDFAVEVHDVAALKRAVPTAAAASQLGRLRKRLDAGAVLEAGVLAGPQTVLRGDSLRLRVLERGLAVDTLAVAQHDGELGGRIKVLPRNAEQSVQARIVGAGLVQLDGSTQ